MQSLNDMFINSSKHNEPNTLNKELSVSQIHSNLSEINHVKQLSLDIGNLFNNTDYCDLKLIVENVEFKVHKIILAARSEYFRALLFSGMKETNDDCIEIKEARPGAFKLLLQYIYTGKIVLKNEKEESLIDLLGLVHQYGFVELEKSVSAYLESILDIKNVCSIYDISSLYQLKSLEETCARFIDKNSSVIIKQNSLFQLSCDSLASIIGRDSFCAPEIDIFNVVKDWHEHNNVKESKAQLIDNIRLPLMKLEELLNEVRCSNLINSDVILDAIKLKHESNDMSLKYRGVLYPNENIATSRYQAIVVKGEFKSALLDGDVNNYDFDRGFTYHPIDDTNQNSIIVKLGNPTIFNQIKLLLWDKDIRSYSYFIEVSMNEEDWIRVVDYSEYLCRSWQNLYFKPVVARFIKITGVRNTVNRIFHLVSMEVRFTLERYDLVNQLIVPHSNVATIMQSAVVLEGVSRTRNALINGDYKNYDWDSGYTCHQLGSGSISIQLAQPYLINSMRILLWDCDNRSYSYFVETSLDQANWTIVADKRNEACRSWQVLIFPARPVSFIRITGTHNTANEVFHCVHFECPCDSDVLNRYLEQDSSLKSQQQSQTQPPVLNLNRSLLNSPLSSTFNMQPPMAQQQQAGLTNEGILQSNNNVNRMSEEFSNFTSRLDDVLNLANNINPVRSIENSDSIIEEIANENNEI